MTKGDLYLFFFKYGCDQKQKWWNGILYPHEMWIEITCSRIDNYFIQPTIFLPAPYHFT